MYIPQRYDVGFIHSHFPTAAHAGSVEAAHVADSGYPHRPRRIFFEEGMSWAIEKQKITAGLALFLVSDFRIECSPLEEKIRV